MNYVSYLRVSTRKQGAEGLGIEAQRSMIRSYMKPVDSLLREYVEVESGKRNERKVLAKAIDMCKVTGATLLIAKLDRLSRDVEFIARLMKSDTSFVACDMPGADPLRLHIEAAVAEDERRRISDRTKRALAEAKARGVKLGGYRGGSVDPEASRLGRQRIEENRAEFYKKYRPIIETMSGRGVNAIARQMNALGLRTMRGKEWHGNQVSAMAKALGVRLGSEQDHTSASA